MIVPADDLSTVVIELDCDPVREIIDGQPGGLMGAHRVRVTLSIESPPKLEEVHVAGMILEPQDAWGKFGWYFRVAFQDLVRNPDVLDAWVTLLKRRADNLREAKGEP